MAKGTRKYFREKFYGAETANIYPSESFPIYGKNLFLYGFLIICLSVYSKNVKSWATSMQDIGHSLNSYRCHIDHIASYRPSSR